MEQKKRLMTETVAIIGLLILIIDSRHALSGARDGIDLCIKTVIPSLFPFFVLSTMLIHTLTNNRSGFMGFFAKVLGISKSAESILIPSFLGGYPIGAKCVGDLYQTQQIGRKEAERLLAFSSNAGPSFLFGMVSGFFPEQKMVWMLWFIHIFSAVLTATAIPAKKETHQVLPSERSDHGTPIIWTAAKAMCMVCCWVILFRIIITFLTVWFLWIFPQWLQTLLIGILELSNGCCELPQITDIKLRFIICSCILAFGGICVFFQTISVTQGLSIGYYVKGKLMQTLFSFILSCAVMLDYALVFVVWIPILVFIFRKTENRYSNPEVVPV